MFALEKARRERLEATMHHFEQHMHQRELTLAEKVCYDYAPGKRTRTTVSRGGGNVMHREGSFYIPPALLSYYLLLLCWPSDDVQYELLRHRSLVKHSTPRTDHDLDHVDRIDHLDNLDN